MRVLTFSLLVACVAGACTVSTNSAPGDADVAKPSVRGTTPAPTPTSMDADATAYDCDDHSVVHVSYGEHDAILQLADKPAITLPRAESASTAGVDVYVGRDVALQREGDSIQLELTGASLRCWPAPEPGSD